MVKNLIWNVKNIIRWIPRLWNNYNWDYNFLLEVLKYKSDDMAKYFDDANIIENSKDVSAELTRFSALLQNILDEKWNDIFTEYHEKYPFEIETDKDGNSFIPAISDRQRAEFLDLHKKSGLLRDKMITEMCDALKNGIGKWWD